MDRIWDHRIQFMISEENTTMLKEYLDDRHNHINDEIAASGDTILHFACRFEKVNIVKYLVANGVRVNIGNQYGHTALFLTGSMEITRLLIEAGANMDQRDVSGNTALHKIISGGNPSFRLIELHLNSGAHAVVFNDNGDTPILDASKLDSSNIIRLLVRHGGGLMYRNKLQHNPFHIACKWNKLEVIKYLVTQLQEVNINEQDQLTKTPLHYAVMLNRHEICKVLLKHGAEINLRDKDERTPLHYALSNRSVRMVRLLLNYRAVLEVKRQAVVLDLHEMDHESAEFTALLSLHVFANNDDDIVTKVRRGKISSNLTELTRLQCRINNEDDDDTHRFPNIFIKTTEVMADFLMDADHRRMIKEQIMKINVEHFKMLRDLFQRRYDEGIRLLSYKLIERSHLEQSILHQLLNGSGLSIFTKILDFVDLNDLKNVLTSFGISQAECYF